jgi:hypothetical protein
VAWQDFKLIGFAPDLPVTTPGYFVQMYNAVPTDRGIGNGPSLFVGSSTAINTLSLGGALLSKTDATQELIVGTATKLYGYDLVTTLTDRSGGAYNASATNTWSVTNFGNIALAANLGDQLQQRTIGAAANFASVGAAPVPKASIVVTCGPTSAPFVMVFDYTDGVNTDRDGWKCSAVSDYTGWTTGTNSCATGRLLDNIPGPVTAAIPYRDGVIAWKRTGMYVGEYTGPPNIWSWRRISSDVGCIGKNACVEANDAIYFADDSGLWVYDGSYPKPVPGYTQKYWCDLVASASPTAADRNYHRVFWDKPRHLLWFFVGQSSQGGQQYGVSYNTVSGLWCLAAAMGNAGATLLTGDWISARYFVDNNKKVGYVSWGANNTEPDAATLTGWCVSNSVDHAQIKGVRPHWSTAPSSLFSGWCSGNLYTLFSERDLVPGATAFGALSTTPMAFRQPGKLDGVICGEVVTFDISVIAGKDWEITGTSVDLGKAGRS